MIKNKILFPLLFCFSLIPSIGSSCSQASPINSSNFCASFKDVAYCHCSARLPAEMCTDMNTLYQLMLSATTTKTLAEACSMQTDTSPQNCIDDWNCYRNGGRDSTGKLCSGTGNKCE